ncbi:hypothetical protein P4317_31695, partial [Brevibacillus porteri]|nr:hypothetical protein [Brevibacillus porteri]
FVIDDTWGDDYVFDYHWTTGVGYFTDDVDDLLYIHDSVGGDRYVDYRFHEDIITMVSVNVE